MRLLIAAIGRLKDDAERTLYDRYAGRLAAGAGRSVALGPLETIELVEARQASSDVRRDDEAERLLGRVDGASVIVALDEAGKAMSSEAFARFLARERDDGTQSIAFLLGGPDGHGAAALEAARVKLSLGPMTLPHGLARVIIAEQLYRAATILSGHPYHRG